MTARFHSARQTASEEPERLAHVSGDFSLRTDTATRIAHYYRKRGLRDPEVVYLIPWCEEGKPDAKRHPRENVGPLELRANARCVHCLYRAIP